MSDFVKNDPRLTFDEDSHTYRLGDQRLVSVTQALALTGLADFNAPWFTATVKRRGTYVHDAVRLDVEGVLDEASLDDHTRGAVEGWRAFLRDTSAEVEFSEQMLCDPDAGIAGRLDYIVRMPHASGLTRRVVVDLKSALYPCVSIQLAAYVEMALALYDTPVVLHRAALVLPGDGSYRFHPFDDHTDRYTWQAVVRVVQWQRAHGLAA